jgi:hypothetical protein
MRGLLFVLFVVARGLINLSSDIDQHIYATAGFTLVSIALQ